VLRVKGAADFVRIIGEKIMGVVFFSDEQGVLPSSIFIENET
jgi:hypothetical protein